MKYFNKTFLLLILTVWLLVPASLALAQSPGLRLSSSNIRLKLSPPHPEPNETVTVEASGSGFSLDSATIAWSKNNEVQTEGVGKKKFTFTAGTLGETTRITATVLRQNGRVITEAMNVTPVNIDLMWEADSYTPPLYRGKSMRAPEGSARVIAFVDAYKQNGNKFNKENLFFRWEFNGRAIAEYSGYGEDTFPSDLSRYENTIALEISTRGDRILAREEVTIPNSRPQIAVYQDHPLRDVEYERAIGDSLQMRQDEIRLTAVPYFFDISNTNVNDLRFQWEVDGSSVDTENRRIRLSKNAPGSSVPLSIEVFHPQRQLQRSNQVINIQMLESNQTNDNE